jgi:hypothetical protein
VVSIKKDEEQFTKRGNGGFRIVMDVANGTTRR